MPGKLKIIDSKVWYRGENIPTGDALARASAEGVKCLHVRNGCGMHDSTLVPLEGRNDVHDTVQWDKDRYRRGGILHDFFMVHENGQWSSYEPSEMEGHVLAKKKYDLTVNFWASARVRDDAYNSVMAPSAGHAPSLEKIRKVVPGSPTSIRLYSHVTKKDGDQTLHAGRVIFQDMNSEPGTLKKAWVLARMAMIPGITPMIGEAFSDLQIEPDRKTYFGGAVAYRQG